MPPHAQEHAANQPPLLDLLLLVRESEQQEPRQEGQDPVSIVSAFHNNNNNNVLVESEDKQQQRCGSAGADERTRTVFYPFKMEETHNAYRSAYADSPATTTRSSTTNTTSASEEEDPTAATVSNEYVLNVAFWSFMSFVVLEGVVGYCYAHSQSMVADASAMSVDALTYLTNLVAERMKQKLKCKLPTNQCKAQQEQQLQLQRSVELKCLYLELVPPALSAMTLAVITYFTLQEALTTLFPSWRNSGVDNAADNSNEDDEVSVPIMLFFSAGNLLLDIVNVTCFARAQHAYGITDLMKAMASKNNNNNSQRTEQKEFRNHAEEHDLLLQEEEHVVVEGGGEEKKEADYEEEEIACHVMKNYGSLSLSDAERGTIANPNTSHSNGKNTLNPLPTLLVSNPTPHTQQHSSSVILYNLNMCSAWTHVCADTLRSIAVVIAASIATIFAGRVDGETADSSAALVVSGIIFVSLLPLLQGLLVTARRIVHLHRQQQHDPEHDPVDDETNMVY